MTESPLATLRQATADLEARMDALANRSNSASQRAAAVEHLSQILRTVDRAIQSAPPSMVGSKEWRDQTALYADALRELQTHLAQLEIALRIRRSELLHARARIGTVGAWASLARHIG